MKKTTKDRRCLQCTRLFAPDRRVGARQVTCGCTECKRLQHAQRCRAWRAANGEVGRKHYQDVVVPFRAAQPSYQRRWRLGRRLVEIREQVSRLMAVAKSSLEAAMGRAGQLELEEEASQSGVITGRSLPEILSAVATLTAALEGVEAHAAQLAALGV